MSKYYVYIMASSKNGTIYVGSTSNLAQRIRQHKFREIPGFSSKYGVAQLVYFEESESALAMANRERQIKKWNRAWKLELIEKDNPEWADLSDTIG